jgi:nitroreductase
MALEDPIRTAATDALALRYGKDAPSDILWNDTIAGLLAHRSVRAFSPDALPERTVETLVAAAQSAASSSNLQLWSVVAVFDLARRQQLAALAGGQKHIAEAPLILLWIADLARGRQVAAEAGEPHEGFDFLESFTVAAIDAALAAQNAVVAAESLGLGTVYIGALRNRPEDVAEVAGLPPSAVVAFRLVVGWPDEERPAAVKPSCRSRSCSTASAMIWRPRTKASPVTMRHRALSRQVRGSPNWGGARCWSIAAAAPAPSMDATE